MRKGGVVADIAPGRGVLDRWRRWAGGDLLQRRGHGEREREGGREGGSLQ